MQGLRRDSSEQSHPALVTVAPQPRACGRLSTKEANPADSLGNREERTSGSLTHQVSSTTPGKGF